MAAADFGWRFADARNLYGFYNGIDVRRTRSGGGSPPAHRGSHRPYPVSCAGMVPAPSHDMRHPKSNEERRATNGHDSCVRWAAQPSVFVRASSSERLRQSVFVRASSSERLRQSVFVRASSSERLRQSVFVRASSSERLRQSVFVRASSSERLRPCQNFELPHAHNGTNTVELMTNQDSHMKLVCPKGSQAPELPHEQLDVYDLRPR